jgi:hypothetical protein
MDCCGFWVGDRVFRWSGACEQGSRGKRIGWWCFVNLEPIQGLVLAHWPGKSGAASSPTRESHVPPRDPGIFDPQPTNDTYWQQLVPFSQSHVKLDDAK